MVDRNVQLTVNDSGKKRVGAFKQFSARRHIVVQPRPRREQRTMVVKFGQRERRHWTGGVAEADEQSARPQAGQRSRERGLADAVINHVAQFIAADLFDPGNEILLVVEDDVIAAIGQREIRRCR